jgi:hypothetical protein
MKPLFAIIVDWVNETRPKAAGWHCIAAAENASSGSISYGRGATDWPGHGYIFIDPDAVTPYRRVSSHYERQDKIMAADPSFFKLLSKQMELIELDMPVRSI